MTQKLFLKNTIYNIFGQGFPLFIGLFFIPILMNKLGIEQFGILSLIWIFFNYFSFLDFGFSRATTKIIAESLCLKASHNYINQLIWASLLLLALVSLFAMSLWLLITPFWIGSYFKVSVNLLNDVKLSFLCLSLAIPIIVISSIFRGILEAHKAFLQVNIIQFFQSTLSYIGVWLTYLFFESLFSIIILLLLLRLISLLVLFYFVKSKFSYLNYFAKPDLSIFKRLFYFGGWISVSSIVSPILDYSDRFIISSFFPLNTIAYYTTSYDLMSKLLLIPNSLARVLFPTLSGLQGYPLKKIYSKASFVLLGVLFLTALSFILLAHPILRIWLNLEFANKSSQIFQLLLIGFMLNGLAYVPYTLIQSQERADLTAKIHLIELPFFVLLLWFLSLKFGLIGAALGWVIRVGIDFLLLSLICLKWVDSKKIVILTLLATIILIGVFFLNFKLI